MTILESLQSMTNYPVSPEYIEAMLTAEGMNGLDPFTGSTATDARYLRTKRQVCLYVATAPNVSQGGISYSLDSDARGQMLDMAAEIAESLSEERLDRFGYIGDEL